MNPSLRRKKKEKKSACGPRETATGVALWNIKEERPEGNRFVACFAEVSGYRLSADEAAALYLGNDVAATLKSRESNKPFDASLFPAGIKTAPRTVGTKTFENRTMQMGIAVHVKSEGKRVGYLVDGVRFPASRNGVTLAAGECWKLLNGKTVEKDGVKIEMTGIQEVDKEGKTYKNANVSMKMTGETVRPKGEEIKTEDGLTVRFIRAKKVREGETEPRIVGYRVTRGEDSSKEGVGFKAETDEYALNPKDAADLFRGNVVRKGGVELQMSGIQETSPQGSKLVFKSAVVDAVKIHQAEDVDEALGEGEGMKI